MNLTVSKPSTRNYMPSTWQNISRIEKSDRHTPLMGACYTWGPKKSKREYKDKPPRETANSRGFFFVLYKNNIYENSCWQSFRLWYTLYWVDRDSAKKFFNNLHSYFFMMGICVVVAQQTLTLLVQVRFLYPLPRWHSTAVVQLLHTQSVVGSNPTVTTNFGGIT